MKGLWALLVLVAAILVPVGGGDARAASRGKLGVAVYSAVDVKAPTRPVLSDGERYVAYVPTAGTVRIRDTKTGGTSDAHTACLPVAAGAAHVLLSCGQPGQSRPAILSALTLSIRVLAPDPGQRYLAIGRFWLSASDLIRPLCPSPCGSSSLTYINWHSGRVRTVDGDRNLDSRDLRRQPVAPRGFGLYARDRGSVIFQRDSLGSALQARDQRGKVTRLSVCRPDCEPIDPGAGKVTWLQFPTPDGVYYGYDVTTHRRYRWPIRVAPSLDNAVADLTDVVHTRYEVLVSTLQADYGNSDLASYTVLATSWTGGER